MVTKLVGTLCESNFAEHISASDTLVVVDFWAAWCPPCLVLNAVIDALALDYQGRVCFYKIDADASPNVAAQYQVRGLPTLLFFKDGQVTDRVLGAQTKAKLCKLLDNRLPGTV